MKKLLNIDTSINLENSNTRKLTQYFIENWKDQNSGGEIVTRDLVKDNIPHLDGISLAAFSVKPEEQTDEMKEAAQYTNELIKEILDADELVIGVPMYNFGIPSNLKAYIDHIARAGITFQYTDKGPVGLIKGKKLNIITARGGFYAGTDMDHQEAYLKTFFQFLGFTDINFIHAEGVVMNAEESITKAKIDIQTLLAA